MKLVIVESPTKARTLSRFLGNGYQIEASMGHIRDLPKSVLGVDIEHNFEPQYVAVKGKEQVVRNLKARAKEADTIILATDPDREGEAIASHVRDVLRSNSEFRIQNSEFKRIVFHEITKEAIEEALKNPRDVNTNLVNAQTARRVLDRLVGYKLSPLLWKKVRRGLSAGRVQSVAVRLIVEREREIEKFAKKAYWTIVAQLVKKTNGTDSVAFELFEIDEQKIEEKETIDLYDGPYTFTKTTIDTKQKADAILSVISGKPFVVADILQKEMRRSPYPPFTTSTLAQEGSRRLGFSSKQTMTLAQKLYEEGFITYHRTDSVNMANQAVFSIRNFVEKEYGKRYVNSSPRMYKTKQKLAQEAHECIRPTNINDQPFDSAQGSPRGFTPRGKQSTVNNQLGREHGRLYDLIWKRAVASQMSDAVLESTTVLADVLRYRFKATGSVVVFDGFLKLYPQALTEQKLPTYTIGETLNAKSVDAIEHETTPPPRYNEASLIATLEEKGIGRPSTYAPIISTIEERRYVEKEEGKFKPTTVGIAVNDFLVTNFSDIDDIPFTAQMEDNLDEIAHGQREWVAVMAEFYGPFEKKLDEVKGAARVKIAVEETQEKCPQCGSNLIIRVGRFGKFMACSKFPECKFTKSFAQDVGIDCPLDGGPSAGSRQGRVILKKTRRGRNFYGCSNYPNCKFAAWRLEDIKKSN